MIVHGKRALLNQEGQQSTAAIVAEIEDTSTWKKGCERAGKPLKYNYDGMPEIIFRIANCDRSIEFIFPTEEQAYENNIFKADTMIEALTEFRDGLVIEQERHKKRQADLERKRKDKARKKRQEREKATQ